MLYSLIDQEQLRLVASAIFLSMTSFHDQVVVVTGASQGIGLAIAMAFGSRGARIAMCAREPGRLAKAARTVESQASAVFAHACDVTDHDDVTTFRDTVLERLGTPTVLVNNAGIGRFAPVDEMSVEEFDAVMRANVRSLFLVTRAFLPAMKSHGQGTIVNIVSLAGKHGFVGGAAYAASKHAALGFTKSLMLEVRAQGIRVMAVCPGSVDTPFFDKQDWMRPNRERILRPGDVAEAVLAAVGLPDSANVSEIDIRPTNPT